MHKFHIFEHRLGSPILDQGSKGKSKKIRRKCATVAPYSILYRFLCNALQRARENPKKYGANAPQLHPIRCSIDFCVMLCNEQGKIQKNTAQMRHSCALFDALSIFV